MNHVRILVALFDLDMASCIKRNNVISSPPYHSMEWTKGLVMERLASTIKNVVIDITLFLIITAIVTHALSGRFFFLF